MTARKRNAKMTVLLMEFVTTKLELANASIISPASLVRIKHVKITATEMEYVIMGRVSALKAGLEVTALLNRVPGTATEKASVIMALVFADRDLKALTARINRKVKSLLRVLLTVSIIVWKNAI